MPDKEKEKEPEKPKEEEKKEEPKVEEKKEEKKKKEPEKEPEPKTEKQELLDNMEACIKEFGGISNIPYKHPYWDWANKFRSL